jgi:mono/diheme cytochrome c family protein
MRRRSALAALLFGVTLGAALLSSGTAAPRPDEEIAAGHAVYQRACAVCHGESGRGDGPSAGSFATKPSDLTDGRLMNPLPDEFLTSIVLDGGPAEGLTPGMPPFRGHLSEQQVRQVVAYVRTLAKPAFSAADAKGLVTVPGAPAQPIFFSHLIHAGSFGIACQYCHANASRGPAATVPSVERCMGCHKIVGAQDNPEIAKLHQYWNSRTPIPWVRIFKVPEFTYFPHKPHVVAGVACQTCHGPIERMRVVGARTGRNIANDLQNLVGLRPPPPPLTMGWCIDCHTEQNAQGKKAPLDCFACHH